MPSESCIEPKQPREFTRTRPWKGHVTHPQKKNHVIDRLDHVGLTATVLAKRLAQGIAWMDEDDVGARALGQRCLHLALKVRGDIIPVAAAIQAGPPPNLEVLIAVLREMKRSTPQPVVGSIEGPERNLGQEPQAIDITPESDET